MAGRIRIRHWKRWLTLGAVVVALAVVGGPFIYIHVVEGKAPAPLTLGSPSASSSSDSPGATGSVVAAGSTDGAWKVTSDSVVGYRVKEVLFGQSHVAVGRTGSITGSITVSGTAISGGSFTVDMTTVTSDQSRRDEQFNGRIMDTAAYPTATFTVTQQIDFRTIPAAEVQRTLRVNGNLTLHGVTKAVAFTVTARYTGSEIQVAGSIPIAFVDWNIPNPRFGPVSTEDHGVLEFSLHFVHA